MKFHALLCAAVVCLATAVVPTAASAQYHIHSWESFENGALPRTMLIGHKGDATTFSVLPYSGPKALPGILEGIAPEIVGSNGLYVTTNANRNTLSLVSPVALDRNLLGPGGRALYQADFYLPKGVDAVPNTALLAIQVNGNWPAAGYKMYRFGISEGGAKAFFAFADDAPGSVPGAPKVYHAQTLSDFKLKRPGWHRFQMIFNGKGEIACAINMVPTKFSPIKETTLNPLNAGLMIASTASSGEDRAWVDNLSIQWSKEDVPLPDSPWVAAPIPQGQNPIDAAPGVTWETNPKQAWKLSTAMKKPILVKFYAPKGTPYAYLRQIVPATDQTRALLAKYVLLNVDVNQLEGGTLAQRYRIARVPTLMVMGADGKEVGRIGIARNQTTWEQVSMFLNSPAGAADASGAAVAGAGGP